MKITRMDTAVFAGAAAVLALTLGPPPGFSWLPPAPHSAPAPAPRGELATITQQCTRTLRFTERRGPWVVSLPKARQSWTCGRVVRHYAP